MHLLLALLPLTFSWQHTDQTRFDAFASHDHVFQMALAFTLISAGAWRADSLAFIFYFFNMPAVTLRLAKCLAVSGDVIGF